MLTEQEILEILSKLELRFNSFSSENKERALRILYAHGSKFALKEGLNYLLLSPTCSMIDNFPSLISYSAKDWDLLCQYLDLANKIDCVAGPHTILDSVVNTFSAIAMTSLDYLKKVKDLFRLTADAGRYKYLYKIADRLDQKFYEGNGQVYTISLASQMFDSINQL